MADYVVLRLQELKGHACYSDTTKAAIVAVVRASELEASGLLELWQRIQDERHFTRTTVDCSGRARRSVLRDTSRVSAQGAHGTGSCEVEHERARKLSLQARARSSPETGHAWAWRTT